MLHTVDREHVYGLRRNRIRQIRTGTRLEPLALDEKVGIILAERAPASRQDDGLILLGQGVYVLQRCRVTDGSACCLSFENGSFDRRISRVWRIQAVATCQGFFNVERDPELRERRDKATIRISDGDIGTSSQEGQENLWREGLDVSEVSKNGSVGCVRSYVAAGHHGDRSCRTAHTEKKDQQPWGFTCKC